MNSQKIADPIDLSSVKKTTLYDKAVAGMLQSNGDFQTNDLEIRH
jgi:hypothetical protein